MCNPSFYVCVQEAAWTVTDECIQIMGGMGFMKVMRPFPPSSAGFSQNPGGIEEERSVLVGFRSRGHSMRSACVCRIPEWRE